MWERESGRGGGGHQALEEGLSACALRRFEAVGRHVRRQSEAHLQDAGRARPAQGLLVSREQDPAAHNPWSKACPCRMHAMTRFARGDHKEGKGRGEREGGRKKGDDEGGLRIEARGHEGEGKGA